MKKRKFGRKLSRGSGARKALYRSLIKALVEHGSITTTKVKAKTIQRDVDKMINIAKNDSVAARRRVYARLGNDRKTTDNIFKLIAPKFLVKKGGYTRIVNLPRRRGDYAEMARFEWTERVVVQQETKRGKKSDRKHATTLQNSKSTGQAEAQNKKKTQRGRLSKLKSKIGGKRAK